MPNPWLSVPLEDYEDHMRSAEVQQSAALAELFKRTLDLCLPESVALLGVAGGNGLEQIDPEITKRIVGLDINPRYLDEVRRRFPTLPGLELIHADLTGAPVELPPVALVHAALIFEHTGADRALQNALRLVASGGKLSIVLQMPSITTPGVSVSRQSSMQSLAECFKLIDRDELQGLLEQKGLRPIAQETRSLPAGKAFWLGIFSPQ